MKQEKQVKRENKEKQEKQGKQGSQFQVIRITKKHWMWLGLTVLIMSTAILLSMCTTNPFLVNEQAATGEENDSIEAEMPIDQSQQLKDNAERWYKQSCALCHGDEREGRLSNPPLTDVENKYNADKVFTFIIDGKGDMPGGFLQGSEARAVAEWLMDSYDN